MSKNIKVVFLGSGPIAIPILQKLASDPSVTLQAVVSQLDRPAGRKRILTPTPLAAAALEAGLEVIRTADVNTPEFSDFLNQLAPDLLCVVSFGQILKSGVLSAPKVCCVNIHASLLPRYRGASPIVQSIINRDEATGVCFMQMERGLDSGPVFKELRLPLDGSEYADSLEMALGELAANNAVEILHGVADGSLPSVPQNPAEVTICRKISKRDGMIDWNNNAGNIEAMTRAYFPWPGAVTECLTSSGKRINITICSAKCIDNPGLNPGECTGTAGKIIVGCGENSALEIVELIPSGGKRMNAAAFRNGMRGELPRFICCGGEM